MAEKKVVRYKLVRHKWPDEIEAERKRRKRRILWVLSCVLCLAAGFGSCALWRQASVVSDPAYSKLMDIYDIMRNDFYFGKEETDFSETLMIGAINGMVAAGNDPHTMYMDADTSLAFTTSMEGSVVGIGVTFYTIGNTYMISDVVKDGPAEHAGVLPGDEIYAVDGTEVKDKSTDEVVSMVTGESGTDVKIDFLRDGEHIVKTITRAKVSATVFSSIQGDTAVVELTSFAESSGEELGRHLKDIKDSGCTNLIFDLRGNGGGYLKSAIVIASYLMGEDKLIFKEEAKDGSIQEYRTSGDYEHYEFDKLIILVDGGTASASEVVTAALQEKCGAIVVGNTTYGKGTVQIPLPFSDGSMLKYTVGEWITPSDKKINGVGITPDVKVDQEAALASGMPILTDEVYEPDTVNDAASAVQIYLKFLGYGADRSDSYFSLTSSEALKQYQIDHNLTADGKIREEVTTSLISEVMRKWKSDPYQYDLQLKKAMELANE